MEGSKSVSILAQKCQKGLHDPIRLRNGSLGKIYSDTDMRDWKVKDS